jgi:hypothetical protein
MFWDIGIQTQSAFEPAVDETNGELAKSSKNIKSKSSSVYVFGRYAKSFRLLLLFFLRI